MCALILNFGVSKMSEKKVVSRNVAIGIGVICIVLVVALVVIIFDYELTLNNKDSTITSLSEQVDSLNSQIESYNSMIASLNSQISSLQNQSSSLSSQNTNLQNQVDSLNSQITELNSQINTLNATVNTQTIVITEMLLRLDNKYNTTNTDGIYILNYSITYGQVGLSQTYTADITLYNALSTATVTIKLYGSDSKLFTYEMSTGSTLHRVETWTGDIWARDFSKITVDSVER
jgi:predicted PurR-regulated permease PerM